jgi:hypothetical protein
MVLGFGSGGGKKSGGGQKDSGQGKKGSGGAKRPASKSPPKDASQRQRTEASSSTDPPRGGEQLGNWLTKPKSAAQGPPGRAAQPSNRPVVSAPTRHMQQPEQRTSTQRNPKRRIWYCCVCLRQREASPPRQNEMGNDICGNVAKKGPCEHQLSSCGDKTCFTKQADEERPMWFLGLSKVSYWIPWGPRGGPWKSYEPFGLTLRLGKDRWPARYCCACRTNKSSLWREPVRTRYCLHQKFPGDKKRCGTPPCKECTLVPDWWCHMCLQHGHPDARKPVRTELCDRVADSRTGSLCGHQAYKTMLMGLYGSVTLIIVVSRILDTGLRQHPSSHSRNTTIVNKLLN